MACYSSSLALGLLLLISYVSWGSATVHTVGDSSGWTTGFDYSSWAAGKTFVVGDSLFFNYASGAHTVNQVSSGDYTSCSTANSINSDSSGETTLPLSTAGTHYFICGVPGHCSGGMKLAVTVAAAASTTPSSPTPPSSSATPTTPTATKNSGGVRLSPASLVVMAFAVILALNLGLF
ncbi:mavicyanin [Typha latifolia]|uniref:mavicyanin n=1 Tax=Typha latifolia TaxID=4733 RepID=UPI003C2FE99D